MNSKQSVLRLMKILMVLEKMFFAAVIRGPKKVITLRFFFSRGIDFTTLLISIVIFVRKLIPEF